MFVKTCVGRPEIAEHTHEAHLSCSGMSIHGTLKICEILNGLLTRLKSLHQLEIDLHLLSDSNDSSLPALYQDPFSELRSLELYLPTMSAS